MNKITPDILFKMIWVSSFLAAIFALPALGVFLVTYDATDNLALAAVSGFGLHFVILAFSGKISSLLTRIIG